MYEEQISWEFFKSKGLSDEAVSGILGNLKAESGYQTTAINESESAYGIAQWRQGRRTGLEAYAKSKGQKITSLQTQLEYFWHELTTTERSTLQEINSGKYSSPEEYAQLIDVKFERSDGSTSTERQQFAKDIYNAYSNKTVDTNDSMWDKIVETTTNANNNANQSYLDNDAGAYTGENDGFLQGALKVVFIIISLIAVVMFVILALGSIGKGEDNGDK